MSLVAIERCLSPYSRTAVCSFSNLNVSSLYLFCDLKKCCIDLILPSGWSVMCLPLPVLHFCCSLLQANNPDNFVQNKTCLGCFAMNWYALFGNWGAWETFLLFVKVLNLQITVRTFFKKSKLVLFEDFPFELSVDPLKLGLWEHLCIPLFFLRF